LKPTQSKSEQIGEEAMNVVREPYGYVYKEESRLKEVYGGPTGRVFVECMRIRPETGESKTALLFTHPIGGGSFLPLVTALARAGHHIIYCNTRYRGNDTALILEKCVLDLGACIADLKQRFGYEKVVMGGWSGGGSLSLFYQDQAEHPTITATAAGDDVDLTAANLQPADGVMLLAAHISRSVTMTEWMDPSITDEDRPFDRDPELNIYDPACPAQPPYSEAFVARFRAAQIARNRRITARVKQTLADLKASGQPVFSASVNTREAIQAGARSLGARPCPRCRGVAAHRRTARRQPQVPLPPRG
jgi:pimeloyl-ACP methyl ester carboxylesterase